MGGLPILIGRAVVLRKFVDNTDADDRDGAPPFFEPSVSAAVDISSVLL